MVVNGQDKDIKSEEVASHCLPDGVYFILSYVSVRSTCIPPTPITKNSWPMKRDAKKLSNAVPAKDRKSENRLQ